MPTTPNGAPYPGPQDPNNVPADLQALAEWADLQKELLDDDVAAFIGDVNAATRAALAAATDGAVQTFTVSATWTKPAGAKRVHVFLIGGGGSAAHGSNNGDPSGGYGGGAAFWTFDADDLPSTVTVTVGSGGAAPAFNGGGLAGGDTTFGTFLRAKGGPGGVRGQDASFYPPAPFGAGHPSDDFGSSSTAHYDGTYGGGAGAPGHSTTPQPGGSSTFAGAGGAGGATNPFVAPAPGQAPGGGGGASVDGVGGVGARGEARIIATLL